MIIPAFLFLICDHAASEAFRHICYRCDQSGCQNDSDYGNNGPLFIQKEITED